MQILVRNTDNIIIGGADSITLDGNAALIGNTKYLEYNTSNSTVVDTTYPEDLKFSMYIYEDSAIAVNPDYVVIIDPTIAILLGEAKEAKVKEVQNKYQDIMVSLISGYAEYEASTFAIQEAEWKAWYIDDTSGTPAVDRLAAARGIDRLVLLEKIGVKTLAIFDILGSQHAEEDAINAAATKEELEVL